MATFRRNHRSKHRLFSGWLKLILLCAIMVIMAVLSRPFLNRLFLPKSSTRDLGDLYYLPAPTKDQVYRYKSHVLAYSEHHEQPSWAAYELKVQHLNASKVERSDFFREDPAISTRSATFLDYKNSGYTKGHLVPAADRAFSAETMQETFLMSNICPQVYAFNGGIWRELEEQIRDWARKHGALYIVTGPIFDKRSKRKIGANQVAVPSSFFKVVIDSGQPRPSGIGFVIPNAISFDPLQDYIKSIDEVEAETGFDFFADLFTDSLEESVESEVELSHWPLDPGRFQTRIEYWNNPTDQ